MSNKASKKGKVVVSEGGTRWGQYAVLAVVCVLVIGFYAWNAKSGKLELTGMGARDSYYNLQVQGFRDGHLSVKREAPPELAQFVNDEVWLDDHGLHDLSYYKGKLYLYFGVTPALVLFWPYTALTGHYLSHKDATVFFFLGGFSGRGRAAVVGVAALFQGKRCLGGGGRDAGSRTGQFRADDFGAVRCL
jgi:hypothetical protein